MFDNILVPLDGSEVGEAALPYVEKLISKLAPGAKVGVTLFQVLSPTHYVVAGEAAAPIPYIEAEMEQLKGRAMEYLEKAGANLKSRKVSVECKVAIGNAADEINRIADEIDADLVAMSTHGRSGFSRWAFGSVTDKVLRGGNRPVLLIRAQDKETKS
jgi:nucleotide-binding universal stress UspA family protein